MEIVVVAITQDEKEANNMDEGYDSPDKSRQSRSNIRAK